jgi:hypothetical protein
MVYRGAVAVMMAVGLAGATGCGSARLVAVDQGGGVVAIPSNTNFWPTYYREKAELLIAEKAPGGYEIVREEEVVTGVVQQTRNDTKQNDKPVKQGSLVIQETTQTTEVKSQTEYRITFRKVAPAPGTPPPPAPPADPAAPKGP